MSILTARTGFTSIISNVTEWFRRTRLMVHVHVLLDMLHGSPPHVETICMNVVVTLLGDCHCWADIFLGRIPLLGGHISFADTSWVDTSLGRIPLLNRYLSWVNTSVLRKDDWWQSFSYTQENRIFSMMFVNCWARRFLLMLQVVIFFILFRNATFFTVILVQKCVF